MVNYTLDKFIERANIIHGDKYIYSYAEYVDYRTPLAIFCPFHGIFYQSPNKHLSKKRGCPKCAIGQRAKTQILNKANEFVERVNKVHNNFYIYDKTEYQGVKIPITITCPIHGDFIQTPNDHLNGHGCPKCNQSKLEREIEFLLKENNIKYISQQKVPTDETLKLDFYLPDYNLAIECQGEQHFNPIDHFGGLIEFKKVQDRDKRKFLACAHARVNIIYYINNIIIYNNILNNINKNNIIYNSNNTFNTKENILEYIKTLDNIK